MLRQIITRTLPLEMSSKVGALDYQVRWRRKPRWFPQAKSKVFRCDSRFFIFQFFKSNIIIRFIEFQRDLNRILKNVNF